MDTYHQATNEPVKTKQKNKELILACIRGPKLFLECFDIVGRLSNCTNYFMYCSINFVSAGCLPGLPGISAAKLTLYTTHFHVFISYYFILFMFLFSIFSCVVFSFLEGGTACRLLLSLWYCS